MDSLVENFSRLELDMIGLRHNLLRFCRPPTPSQQLAAAVAACDERVMIKGILRPSSTSPRSAAVARTPSQDQDGHGDSCENRSQDPPSKPTRKRPSVTFHPAPVLKRSDSSEFRKTRPRSHTLKAKDRAAKRGRPSALTRAGDEVKAALKTQYQVQRDQEAAKKLYEQRQAAAKAAKALASAKEQQHQHTGGKTGVVIGVKRGRNIGMPPIAGDARPPCSKRAATIANRVAASKLAPACSASSHPPNDAAAAASRKRPLADVGDGRPSHAKTMRRAQHSDASTAAPSSSSAAAVVVTPIKQQRPSSSRLPHQHFRAAQSHSFLSPSQHSLGAAKRGPSPMLNRAAAAAAAAAGGGKRRPVLGRCSKRAASAFARVGRCSGTPSKSTSNSTPTRDAKMSLFKPGSAKKSALSTPQRSLRALPVTSQTPQSHRRAAAAASSGGGSSSRGAQASARLLASPAPRFFPKASSLSTPQPNRSRAPASVYATESPFTAENIAGHAMRRLAAAQELPSKPRFASRSPSRSPHGSWSPSPAAVQPPSLSLSPASAVAARLNANSGQAALPGETRRPAMSNTMPPKVAVCTAPERSPRASPGGPTLSPAGAGHAATANLLAKPKSLSSAFLSSPSLLPTGHPTSNLSPLSLLSAPGTKASDASKSHTLLSSSALVASSGLRKGRAYKALVSSQSAYKPMPSGATRPPAGGAPQSLSRPVSRSNSVDRRATGAGRDRAHAQAGLKRKLSAAFTEERDTAQTLTSLFDAEADDRAAGGKSVSASAFPASSSHQDLGSSKQMQSDQCEAPPAKARPQDASEPFGEAQHIRKKLKFDLKENEEPEEHAGSALLSGGASSAALGAHRLPPPLGRTPLRPMSPQLAAAVSTPAHQSPAEASADQQKEPALASDGHTKRAKDAPSQKASDRSSNESGAKESHMWPENTAVGNPNAAVCDEDTRGARTPAAASTATPKLAPIFAMAKRASKSRVNRTRGVAVPKTGVTMPAEPLSRDRGASSNAKELDERDDAHGESAESARRSVKRRKTAKSRRYAATKKASAAGANLRRSTRLRSVN